MSAAGISTAPSTIVPRRLGKIKFMDLDPLEVARQLTIMNSRFFQRITADECLSKAWPKKIGVDTPNIAQMIAFDNATTHWVIVTVLSVDDMKKRASVIKQFINIAEVGLFTEAPRRC
jgi:son of sevenless-like protein